MAQLRFFIGEAWEYLVRGRGTSVASIVALSSVFFLLALVLLVTHNLERMAGRLEAREGLTVFLAEGVDAARAQELAALIQGFGEVREAHFVDREEALRQLEEDLGGFPVGTTLGENPLPHSLMIRLHPTAAAQRGALPKLAAEIRAYEDVEDVVYGDEWVAALEQNLERLRLANLVGGILAAVAVSVVLLTTLKLAFVHRRETIRILKVVGATNRFIRSPFLVLGGMQCLLAGGLALGLLFGARWVLENWLPGLVFLPPAWLFLYLLSAFVLGLLASLVAVEPALRGLEKGREEVLR